MRKMMKLWNNGKILANVRGMRLSLFRHKAKS